MALPPLILIPGLMCTADLFREQLAAIAAGRVVANEAHAKGAA